MERVQFIEHKGKKILHLNFSRLRASDILPVIDRARLVIAKQPPKSVWTLTDVSEATFNAAVSKSLKELVAHNKPYVVAAAVVGVHGLKQILFNAVMEFSGRRLHAFSSHVEAKDWLANN